MILVAFSNLNDSVILKRTQGTWSSIERHSKRRLGEKKRNCIRKARGECMHHGKRKKCITQGILSCLFKLRQQMSLCFATWLQACGTAKGKPALCPPVLPLKAWLYSAQIWQATSVLTHPWSVSWLTEEVFRGQDCKASLRHWGCFSLTIPDPISPSKIGYFRAGLWASTVTRQAVHKPFQAS